MLESNLGSCSEQAYKQVSFLPVSGKEARWWRRGIPKVDSVANITHKASWEGTSVAISHLFQGPQTPGRGRRERQHRQSKISASVHALTLQPLPVVS